MATAAEPKTRKKAATNTSVLASYARAGYRIVGTSTSCTHTFKAEYEEMLAAGINMERKDFNIHAGFTTTFGRNGVRDDAIFVGVSVPLQ